MYEKVIKSLRSKHQADLIKRVLCRAFTIKKGNATVLLNNSKLLVNVLRLDELPGVVFYEINDSTRDHKGWQLAHEESGRKLIDALFEKKDTAFKAATMFLKNIDMTKPYKELIKDASFKQAGKKLSAAAKL